MWIRICECCEKRIAGKGITVKSTPKPLHFCDQTCADTYCDNGEAVAESSDEEALWRMGLPPPGSTPGGRR